MPILDAADWIWPDALLSRQPQGGAPLDIAAAKANGIVDIIDFSQGVPQSLILRTPATAFGTKPKLGVSSQGRCTDATAAFGGWYFSRADGAYCTSIQTHVLVGKFDQISGTYAGIFSVASGDGALHSAAAQYSDATSIYMYRGSGIEKISVPTSAWLDGNNHVFIFEAGPSGSKVYVDNVLVGSNSDTAALRVFSACRLVLFGERTASAAYATKGKAALHIQFNKVLTDVEKAAYTKNPWKAVAQLRSLPMSVGSANSGVFAVYSDSNVSYDIRNSVAIDLAASFALRGAALASLVPAYNIRASAVLDLSPAYNLRSAAQVDLSPTYNVRNLLTSDRAAAYNLRGAVSADLNPGYSIQNAGTVTSDLVAAYGVRAMVQSDASIAYELRGAVQSTLAPNYSLRAAVASDLAASFAVAGAAAAVSSDLTCSYSVFGVAVSCPSAADIAAAVRSELAAELLQLTKVSKIHGVGVPLVVNPSQRTAGDLVQTITTVGDTTTVSAA